MRLLNPRTEAPCAIEPGDRGQPGRLAMSNPASVKYGTFGYTSSTIQVAYFGCAAPTGMAFSPLPPRTIPLKKRRLGHFIRIDSEMTYDFGIWSAQTGAR